MIRKRVFRRCFAGIALVLIQAVLFAGYKARPWTLKPRDQYSAQLTSEGVTIAVEPLLSDSAAAQVFDKNDIVTRGIMPLAIVIFNDNSFPVGVDESEIEVIHNEESLRTLLPNEVVHRLFLKGKQNIWIPQPVPKMPTGDKGNLDALDDFDHKFFIHKTIAPHDKGGGFLYLHIPTQDVSGYLENARVYIPDVYRQDTGQKMIFFEIDLKPAVEASRAK